MRIVRKHTNNLYSPLKNFVQNSVKYDHMKLYDYFKSIKNDRVSNGRYMIKKQELVFRAGLGMDRVATDKCYFVYADAGITHTYDRKKDKDAIFYLNNKSKILKLARLLASNYGRNYLFTIVDRRQPNNDLYVLSKDHKSPILNTKIILK